MSHKRRNFFFNFGGVLVVLLILVAFGTRAHGQTINTYYTEFKIDAREHNVNLFLIKPAFVETVKPLYMPFEDGVQKVDAYVDFAYHTIYFQDGSYMYDNNLKVLVYHELGHYYLRRDHTDELSIMNIDIWKDQFTWEELSNSDQDFYIKELFNK